MSICILTLMWFVFAIQSAATKTSETSLHQLYYSHLSEWSQKPLTAQIDSLHRFIKTYPHYQPVYLKLEERLQTLDRLTDMKKFASGFDHNSPNYTNAQWMLGRYYAFLEQHERALTCFENALSADKENYAAWFEYQTMAYQQQQNPRVQRLRERLTETERQQRILHAHMLLMEMRYKESIQLFESVQPADDWNVYQQYYSAVYRSGDIEKAFDIARIGRDRADVENNFYYSDFFALAELKCRSWIFRESDLTADISRLRTRLKRTDNLILQAQLTKLEADIANLHGQNEKAIALNKEALDGFLKFYDWRRATRTYQDLAEQYYFNNQNVKALQTLDGSIGMATKLENYELLAWAWIQYAAIYRNLGLYKLGEKYLHKAQQAAAKSDNIYLPMNIYASQQEMRALQLSPLQAVSLYTEWRSEQQQQDIQGDLYFPTFSLAQQLDDLGEHKKAYQYYREAFHLAQASNKIIEQAWATAGMAALDLQFGDSTAALAQLQDILSIAAQHKKFKLITRIHFKLGQYYENKGELDKAIFSYNQVIDQYEQKRMQLNAGELAMGFLSQRQTTYERLSECYYQKYDNNQKPENLEHLFHIEELMHARTLKDQMQKMAASVDAATPTSIAFEELVNSYQTVQRQLRTLRQDISEAELDSLLNTLQLYKYDIVNEKIRMGNKDSTQTLNSPLPQLAELQKKLQQQTALLFHISDRYSYALVIQSDTTQIVPLALSRTEMAEQVENIMQPFHHIKPENVFEIPFQAQAAYQLYTKLFQPIEQQCRLTSQLLIIPSGRLAHLPFDMMLSEKPTRPVYTPQHYPDYVDNFLSQRYDFYYSPSTCIFFRDPVKCSPGMLIVADPFKGLSQHVDETFTLRLRTGWRFDPLPFAQLEANAIKNICPNSTVLKGDRATEERIIGLAPNYSIFHIASHAFVDTTFDIFSGLALADDNNSDGLLMGFEIATSPFPCNLVTLSACETGRGTLINGEGVMGLPRQFLASGTQSVIMSTWKVDDQFTAEFMPRFYKHFLQEGFSKVAALSQAKRDVLADVEPAEFYYQHPFFWAAFHLYGDAGTEGEARVVPHWRIQPVTIIFVAAAVVGIVLLVILFLRKKKSSYAH